MTGDIKTWHPGMSDAETKDLAYWERNMLALYLSEGWYNDDVQGEWSGRPAFTTEGEPIMRPRYEGWRRVLSIAHGAITFHVPDDFNVRGLPQIERNWDGHTTPEKWQRVQESVDLRWQHLNEETMSNRAASTVTPFCSPDRTLLNRIRRLEKRLSVPVDYELVKSLAKVRLTAEAGTALTEQELSWLDYLEDHL
jgi:phage terminase large subunit-like protein